jgi:hypothetical protein
MDGSGRRLARWLGVAHRVGSDLCYWLLLESGKVIARTTVQHETLDDILNEDIKQEIERFDIAIDDRLTDDGLLTEDAHASTFYLQDEMDETGVVDPSLVTHPTKSTAICSCVTPSRLTISMMPRRICI